MAGTPHTNQGGASSSAFFQATGALPVFSGVADILTGDDSAAPGGCPTDASTAASIAQALRDQQSMFMQMMNAQRLASEAIINKLAAQLDDPNKRRRVEPTEEETPQMDAPMQQQPPVSRNQIPTKVWEQMQEAKVKLESEVEKLRKLTARRIKITEEVQALEAGAIPSGSKPFKLKFDEPHLDDVMTEEDTTLSVSIPNGTTFRGAKEILHVWHILLNKKWDLEVVIKKANLLEQATGKEAFTNSCKAIATKHKADLLNLGLGQMGEEAKAVEAESVVPHALKLYAQASTSMADKVSKDIEAKSKAALNQSQLLEEISKREPQRLFEDAVKAAVANKSGAKKGKVDTIKAFVSKVEFDESKDISECINKDVQKNGKPGSNKATAPQGKSAKGKGKSKGKDKDKGNSWTTAPPKKGKGKGKGKGKDKTPTPKSGKGTHSGNQDKEKSKGDGKAKSKGKGKNKKGKGK